MREKLQYKLIAAFLLIAVGSMLLSTFIAVKIISARLEKDIEKAIKNAAQITLKEIELRKKEATLASDDLANDPEFIKAFKREDPKAVSQYLGQWKRRKNIDVVMVTDPRHSQPMPPGETLMLIEGKGIKQLLAGTVTFLKERKKVIGTIYTGDMLDETFAEEMEKNTGVTTVLYVKSIPEREDREGEKIEIRGLSTTGEIIGTVFKEGKRFYTSKTKFNDIAYHGLYQPLISSQGTVLGMIFFGIAHPYSFQTAISGQKFFPLIIGLGVILASLFGYTIARGITNPINSFVKAARAISSGDFDQKVDVRSRDEIGVLSAAFNLMTRKLRQFKKLEEGLRRKERLAALGELSAGVAHEIRNPLGVIKNSAEIIRRKPDEHKIEELSTFIIEEVDRLNRVVGNLLEFARPRAPRLIQENINEIMERAVRIIEEKAKAKGVTIKREYSKDLHQKLLCDSGQMEQAFLNILINALDGITSPGGEVVISILPGKEIEEEPSIIDYIYIRVKDNGAGIKNEDIRKIFNPFFTTKFDGTGLGLSIVHKIIENHEGEIGIQSKPGEGTTIIIKLPVKYIV